MNIEIILIAAILVFIVVYRSSRKQELYKYFAQTKKKALKRYEPYSYKAIRKKVKDLGQNYSSKQYFIQSTIMAGAAFIITYLYFYNLIISIIYAVVAVLFVPYLAYLRNKRIYGEFIFEQVQVYTTNVIMEFQTTKAFVKSLEGVYSSGVLENPVRKDVRTMIEMAYENGSIDASIEYMNSKYPYYIVKNMHQLFLQITNEGSKDSTGALENMLMDIDMLVESVYRDRIDRASFHKSFLKYGCMLYLLVAIIQFLLGNESYIELISLWYIQVILHLLILINSYFLMSGEKYYNENVGEE